MAPEHTNTRKHRHTHKQREKRKILILQVHSMYHNIYTRKYYQHPLGKWSLNIDYDDRL